MGRPAYSQKESAHTVRERFEVQLTKTDLETQIGNCDSFELLPTVLDFLPQKPPILDAGCGSGRWVAWFAQKGYEAAGLDQDQGLLENAKAAFPECRFDFGDIRAMPYGDGEFGSLLSLGSIEHFPEGPVAALSEFRRVLRPGGIAIITVPNGGFLRRVLFEARRIKTAFSFSYGGRRDKDATPLKEARKSTVRRWLPSFELGDNGWRFHQYHFSKSQMRVFLKRAGFSITTEWIAFHDSGIVTHFGRRAGRFNTRREKAFLSPLGKTLKSVFPVSVAGHMLCYVVRKP